MNKVCAFFGHSILVKCRVNVKKLIEYIETIILEGFSNFLIGTYGEFDELCLFSCLELKKRYPHIKIFKVFSNISKMLRETNYNNEIEAISYNIEHLHFKQRIAQTNKFIVDDADLIIAYIDEDITNSGARKVLNYAKKKQKRIVNLFKELNQ